MARNNLNICMEPCTLVYTLINERKLPFDDFSLIVRSLHNYMVESITPNPNAKNVHVKLGYQASVINAQKKLGVLNEYVCVSKLSSFINEDEFSRLEHLRIKYGLPSGSDETPTSYKPGRGRRPIYKPRAAPYSKKARFEVVNREEPETCDESEKQETCYLPNGGDSDQEVHDVE